MSTPVSSVDSAAQAPLDWPLIRRQIGGILRMELRKNLLSKRAFVTYFLAFFPVLLVAFAAVMAPEGVRKTPEAALLVMLPTVFEGYLRTSIFLATLVVFMSLFRNEIMEKSLHYLFLTPVRREVLVAGKYLSMQAAICTIFVLGTIGIFVFVHLFAYGPAGAVRAIGGGFGDLLMFCFVTVLACIGYGAVFLLVGIFFRNPTGPAVMIWAWESINYLLPALFKKASVIHYLHSLYPIPLPAAELDGFFGTLFAVVSESTPAWVSVPGLLIFTGLVLFVASWQTRRMEINYGGE